MNPLQKAIFEAMTQGQQGSEFLPQETIEKMKMYLAGQKRMPMAQQGGGYAPAGYAGTMQGNEWGQLASDPDF